MRARSLLEKPLKDRAQAEEQGEVAVGGKAEGDAGNEGLAASCQPSPPCVAAAWRRCAHGARVGRRGAPAGRPRARKLMARKGKARLHSVYAENPDESTGTHLMTESGPGRLISPIMENFTRHHNRTLF